MRISDCSSDVCSSDLKGVIIPSLIIYGAAGVLAGFGAVWKSYTIVIIARAIQGLGAAGTAPIAMALVGDLYQGGTESKALGLTEASNGPGKVLSRSEGRRVGKGCVSTCRARWA